MNKEQLAKIIYDALISQSGDGIGARWSDDCGFGFQAADNGLTILDGNYDLEAVAEKILTKLPPFPVERM
jgi:hypothetical protein